MNTEHEEGKHKAFVLRTVVGITLLEADIFRKRILLEVKRNPAMAGREDEYGKRYTVTFDWTRNRRTATIRTGWIVRKDETVPRLTSCYIK